MNTRARLAITLGEDCGVPQYSFDRVGELGGAVLALKPAFRALNTSVMNIVGDAISTKGEQVYAEHHKPAGQLIMRAASNLQDQILEGVDSLGALGARDAYRGLAIVDAGLCIVFKSKAVDVTEALDYLDNSVVTEENRVVLEELGFCTLSGVVQAGLNRRAQETAVSVPAVA